MRKIFSVLILCFIFVSCQDENIRIKSAKIDSLLFIVDSLNQQILAVDIDSVNTILSESGELIYKLSKNDALSAEKETVAHISLLVRINRFCGKFTDKYSNFQKELAMSEHQLMTLQQDLEQKSLNDSLYQKYFGEEEAILSKLNLAIVNSIELLQKDISLYQDVYDKLAVPIDSLTKSN